MNERILLVDDDDLVRSGLAANLTRAGYRVFTAASGEEALNKIGLEQIDLVLCDLIMGGMDGLEVLRRVQASWPDILFIMITGHGTVVNALEALKTGASDYIQKPANPDEVIHRVRSVLDSSSLRKALASERHKADVRKKEINEQLLRAERMVSLGLLAEGAAADLQAIMEPAKGVHDQIETLLPADSPVLPHLNQLRTTFQRVGSVVQDLQVIGRSGGIEKSEVNLNTIVDQFMRSEEFVSINKCMPKVRVEVHLSTIMPPIRGSASLLQQMVHYLVLNGCESMPQGGTISLTTSSEHLDHAVGRYGSGTPGEYAVLRIKDAGRGLTAEEIERIFEPFYTHKKMGRRFISGLGMTLVFRAVEEHGGFIDIATGPGKGTMFSLHFPPASRSGSAPLELRPDYSGDETILVIDDYEDHRNTAADILRNLGYRVLLAESGQTAVRLLEQAAKSGVASRIDLVVIDLILGDAFDGVETYKKVIEISPGQKAIMVSGFADIARIVEARKLGIGQCIQKPYALETLGKAVRRELDS